jgi:hypothetical protein
MLAPRASACYSGSGVELAWRRAEPQGSDGLRFGEFRRHRGASAGLIGLSPLKAKNRESRAEGSCCVGVASVVAKAAGANDDVAATSTRRTRVSA